MSQERASYPVRVFNVVLSADNRVYCEYNSEGVLELPNSFLNKLERIPAEVERVVEKGIGFCVGVIKEDLKYYPFRFTENDAGNYYIEMYTVSRYLSGKCLREEGTYQWVDINAIDTIALSSETRRILYKMISNTDKVSALILNQKGASVILVARALIKNSEGKYLFLKRSEIEKYPGKWELPGGKLERHEVMESHVKREVLEETALSIRITKNNVYTSTTIMGEGIYKGVTYVNITAEYEVIGGVLQLSPEHNGYQWVTPTEASQLDLATYIRPVVNELLLSDQHVV